MNDELRSEIEEMISEAIDGLRGELEEIARNAAEEAAEDAAESAAEDALEAVLEDAVADAVEEYLDFHERRLPDGTVIEPRKDLMILSPDKTRLIRCRGSVEVRRWSDQGEYALMIFTGASTGSCDYIHFSNRDEAVAALNKVKDSIEAGAKTVEL